MPKCRNCGKILEEHEVHQMGALVGTVPVTLEYCEDCYIAAQARVRKMMPLVLLFIFLPILFFVVLFILFV